MLHLAALERFFHLLAYRLPLEEFVFLGSLLDELIPPIPTQAIMITAGSVAFAQKYSMVAVVFLALLGAFARTIGCWFYYAIADAFDDVLIPRFGKYIGIDKEKMRAFKMRLSRSWKDDALLLLVRTIPFIPSAVISLVSGALRLPLRNFLLITYISMVLRNALYLYIGFAGVRTIEGLMGSGQHKGFFLQMSILLGIFLLAFLSVIFKDQLKAWFEKHVLAEKKEK